MNPYSAKTMKCVKSDLNEMRKNAQIIIESVDNLKELLKDKPVDLGKWKQEMDMILSHCNFEWIIREKRGRF